MVKIQKNFKSKLVHNNFGFFSDSVNPDPMISGFLRIRVIRKKGFGFFPDLGNPEKRVSFFFRLRVQGFKLVSFQGFFRIFSEFLGKNVRKWSKTGQNSKKN